MPPAEPVLVVALSGRQLAASARRAGFAPSVVDAFGDLDTGAAASAHAVVRLDGRGGFDRTALGATATCLAPPPIPLVWGAGFEAAAELLGEIAEGRELLGNDAQAVRRVKEPAHLAATLARLGVPHPEVRLDAPSELTGWVARTTGASGGAHVHPCSPQGDHWQRRVEGRPVSALVVADGVRARTLCLSEQWSDGTGGSPFRYGGACAPTSLGPGTSMTDAAARAVAGFALSGLVSVDMLADGGDLHGARDQPSTRCGAGGLRGGLRAQPVRAARHGLPRPPARAGPAAAAPRGGDAGLGGADVAPPVGLAVARLGGRSGPPRDGDPQGSTGLHRARGGTSMRATARHRCALRREALLDQLARRAAVDAAEAAAPCPS